MTNETSTTVRGFTRAQVLDLVAARQSQGRALILGGAPNGMVAKAAVEAGIDILMTYNVAGFRVDGHSSLMGYLPYGDANAMTLELGRRVIPSAAGVPVIAGVGAADPYRDMREHITALRGLGFAGLINTPTAGVYSGDFRKEIDSQGIGYPREVEMVEIARSMDFFTIAYAFTRQDAVDLASAGADIIVAHLGTTGASNDLDAAIDDAISKTLEICDGAFTEQSDARIILHGGPLEEASAVRRVLSATPAIGFLGGSGIDRIPVAAAVRGAVSALSDLPAGKPDRTA